MSLERDWQSFLLNENLEKDIFVYIQGLHEVVSKIKPRTMTERRRLALAAQHITEMRRHARRMQGKIDLLEEKLNILEEALNENEEK